MNQDRICPVASNSHRVYFVSGIDTGVGKTIATGVMARWLLQRNVSVATVKLVQTGCHNYSEDLEMHRAIMGVPPFPEDIAGLTAPQTFDFPASHSQRRAAEEPRLRTTRPTSGTIRCRCFRSSGNAIRRRSPCRSAGRGSSEKTGVRRATGAGITALGGTCFARPMRQLATAGDPTIRSRSTAGSVRIARKAIPCGAGWNG